MDEDTSASRRGEVLPGSYGELRRQLAENGDPWTVDPLISDDEMLPDFPLGGLPDTIDERLAAARVDADVDIRALIAELPPNDPGLRARWAEVGMPLDRVPEALTGDRLEEEHPLPPGGERPGTGDSSSHDGNDAPGDAS